MIGKLADQLTKLPNQLLIEGHTDARPFGHRQDYTNWELSSDRANAARRIIEELGAAGTDNAGARFRGPESARCREIPTMASNRRISVIVRYQNAVASDEPKAAEDGKTGGAVNAGEDKSKPSK